MQKLPPVKTLAQHFATAGAACGMEDVWHRGLLVALLTRPDDAGDPQHVGHLQRAVAVLGIERLELDRFCGFALELFHHDLAVLSLDDDAVTLAYRCARRNDNGVAGAVGWLHRVT